MSESWRSLFVRRSVFGRFGPQIAENSPTRENAPTKTGHSGPDSMIPETFRRRCRKLSATVVLACSGLPARRGAVPGLTLAEAILGVGVVWAGQGHEPRGIALCKCLVGIASSTSRPDVAGR